MKLSRLQVTVLLLLTAVSAAYAVALYNDIRRYEEWKQTYRQEHPELMIDFGPYFGTNI